jgi:hypothetical protein
MLLRCVDGFVPATGHEPDRHVERQPDEKREQHPDHPERPWMLGVMHREAETGWTGRHWSSDDEDDNTDDEEYDCRFDGPSEGGESGSGEAEQGDDEEQDVEVCPVGFGDVACMGASQR